MTDFTFLKENIDTIVLCALHDGDKYGYEIAREIKNKTANQYEIKQPTLYAYLKRLENQKQIESYWGVESNGGRRRYYRLTEHGKQVCETFMQNWEQQQNVINSLTSTTQPTPIEVSSEIIEENTIEVEYETETEQEVATEDFTQVIFQETITTISEEDELDAHFSHQDEISTQLSLLKQQAEANDHKNEVPTATSQTEILPEVDTLTEITTAEESNESSETPEQISQTVDSTTTNETTADEPAEEQVTAEPRPNFDIVQDSPEEFITMFDERAKESANEIEQSTQGENYQHVLMKVIGDQLDDMQSYASTTATDKLNKQETEHCDATPLIDLADTFAKQGLRMRIYNKSTANYKSRKLMPVAKVNCITAWLGYAILLVFMSIMLLSTKQLVGAGIYIITLLIALIVPAVFTVISFKNKARKNKPDFNFKFMLILSLIIFAVVVLCSFAISVLAKIEFSNASLIIKAIVFPSVVSAVLPLTVVVYNQISKKY